MRTGREFSNAGYVAAESVENNPVETWTKNPVLLGTALTARARAIPSHDSGFLDRFANS
jgi:hypothetical protein